MFVSFVETLNFNLAEAGILSALPYVGMALVMQVAGFLVDWVRSNYLTTKQVCTQFTLNLEQFFQFFIYFSKFC